MTVATVLLNGRWQESAKGKTFQVDNPAEMKPLPGEYPISGWNDLDEALECAAKAAETLRTISGDRIAGFLERYAQRIEVRKEQLVEMAHAETALPKAPRLADVELPRTTSQLRQAAAAARDGSWSMPTIDTKNNIRSCYGPIGPVCVFGPNNFPFAFGSISGGDFAAAIAAGNPVIAKANSSHPGTTKLFAEEALLAANETGMPPAIVQLVYRTSHEDGERLVSDPRVGATGYTGSRSAGLRLKAAADAVGKPIYLELSSVNPVVILPGALDERLEKLVEEFVTSALMGAGQFCTNPGMVVLLEGGPTEAFISGVRTRFNSVAGGTLLSRGVKENLERSVKQLVRAGAAEVTEKPSAGGRGYSCPNTLLQASGKRFLESPHDLQTEAFGNASLFVVADGIEQACQIIDHLEGNLTGCIYSETSGRDDAAYDQIAPRLRKRVGRLLNDKMPTGVAVSPAMNHGGPYPATGHPGFTAVGIPASMLRFAVLECFDNVRPHRLPALLRNENPTGKTWRSIDGQWTQANV